MTPRNAAPAIVAVTCIALVFASLWLRTRAPARPAPMASERALSIPVQVPDRGPIPAPVSAFLAFAQGSHPGELPLDHAYSSQGLRRLADALDAADSSALSRDRGKRLRAAADALQADPDSLGHADVLRRAFELAAKALGAIGEPGAERAKLAAGLEAAARSIDPNLPLRAQALAIDRYFDLAAAYLDREAARAS